jgi:hypothetical protein
VKALTYVPQDVNRRIPAGRTVEYRVVNVNPFRYSANGKNSFTEFKENFSAEAMAILKPSLKAQAPADPKAPEAGDPEAEATKARTEAGSSQTRTVNRIKSISEDLATLLNPLIQPNAQGELPDPDTALTELRNRTQGEIETLKNDPSAKDIRDEGRKKVSQYQGLAGELVSLRKKVLLQRAANEQADRQKVRVARGQAKAAVDLAYKGQKAAIGRMDEIAGVGTLFAVYAQANDTNVTPIGAKRFAQTDDTAYAIANMRKKASDAMIRTAGRGGTLGEAFDSAYAGANTAHGNVSALLTANGDSLKAAKATNDAILTQVAGTIEGLRKRLSEAESETKYLTRYVERLNKAETHKDYVDGLFELRDAEITQRKMADEIAVLETRQANAKGFEAELAGYVKSDQTLLEQTNAAAKATDEGLTDLRKGVDQAQRLYGEIQGTDFEIVASGPTQTKVGSIDYKLSLNRIEDGKTVELGEAADISYEVFSPNRRRIVESALYVFNGLENKEYFRELNANGTARTDASGRPVIGAETRNEVTDELALFINLPLDQAASNSWAVSFGTNVTLRRYFAGFSYLVGRDQGLTFSAGLAGGLVDVLKRQQTAGVSDPIATAQRFRTSWYVGLGFRL